MDDKQKKKTVHNILWDGDRLPLAQFTADLFEELCDDYDPEENLRPFDKYAASLLYKLETYSEVVDSMSEDFAFVSQKIRLIEEVAK